MMSPSLVFKARARSRVRLPFVAAAVICLGAVVRGETTHDQHINRAVSLAISQLALTANVPVLFGAGPTGDRPLRAPSASP